MREARHVSEVKKPQYRWLYAILLDFAVMKVPRVVAQNPTYDRMAGKVCLYVGSTANPPEVRWEQHRTGYKSSSIVRKYGKSLLPDFCVQLETTDSVIAEREEAWYAAALRERGYGVYQH